ncbi:nuclear transport factor 2 [Diaporthe helianthi]|uniref:Nuclear transport factor 2 n=1 Tax=Diaporthe helianthi TaxID=158607 RepID=A0A2P5IEM6_DIAHE|nr:nuclear transport factor 2 [Diaporthe helianthi]
MADNFVDIAKQFCDFYYQTFDADRKQLGPLYRDLSMLTYESSSVQGVAAIVEKLSALPFQKVQHKITTQDPMPGFTDGGVLVLVTGQLLVDDGEHPMNFAQTFHLMKDASGSFFVSHDIFKLVY